VKTLEVTQDLTSFIETLRTHRQAIELIELEPQSPLERSKGASVDP
jgi:hypothetical protein